MTLGTRSTFSFSITASYTPPLALGGPTASCFNHHNMDGGSRASVAEAPGPVCISAEGRATELSMAYYTTIDGRMCRADTSTDPSLYPSSCPLPKLGVLSTRREPQATTTA